MKMLFASLALLVLPHMAFAQTIQAKGIGTLSYSSAVTPEIKERAYVKAQLNAIERYFAESGQSESENFEAIEPKIAENLDRFILSTAVLNEQEQSSIHKYSVAVRVDINVANLRNTLRGASVVAKANNAAKSQLVYLFVGREIASARSFDVRTLKRSEAEFEDTTSKRGVQRVTAQVETGGSASRKSDDLVYRLLPMTNVTTSITSVFSQGGFIVADPAFAISDRDMKAISKQFSTGNDMEQGTLRSVVASLRKIPVPLIVLATLDAGAPSQDPATGMQRVAVNVSVRVLDLTKPMPVEVVSVPTIQIFGIGPDNQTSRDKGLKEASLVAAREVVNRLNVAQIQ